MSKFRGKTWGVNVKELDLLTEFGSCTTVEVVRVSSDTDLQLDRVRVWIDAEGTVLHAAIG